MSGNKRSIRGWAVEDQPRERMISKNPYCLSDAELLAILIRSGTPDRSALQLARDILLLGQNNLVELGKVNVAKLMQINGIKIAKATTIVAALELGRRRAASISLEKLQVSDSKAVALYLRTLLQDHHYEVFGVLYLNRAGRIRHWYIISQGGMTGTTVDSRIIFRRALEEHATSIILCHNHPSGSTKPSLEDEKLTQKIKEAGKLLDIKLLDHIIVGEGSYFSFADEGIL